jgi:hypothetical protein
MQRLASSLQGALLNRAWIQWAALGVDATVERDDAVVDPEALIALTASWATPTRSATSAGWCVAFGRYVNGSCLKQVVRELRPQATLSGSMSQRSRRGPHGDGDDRPDVRRERRLDIDFDEIAHPASRVNNAGGRLAALLAMSRGLNAADLARVTRSRSRTSRPPGCAPSGGIDTARPVARRRFVLPLKV